MKSSKDEKKGLGIFPFRPKWDASPLQGNPYPSPVVCLQIELTRDFVCVNLYSCAVRERL